MLISCLCCVHVVAGLQGMVLFGDVGGGCLVEGRYDNWGLCGVVC